MEHQIRIEPIKVFELVDFASRVIDKAEPGQFVPISYQRAVAHAKNPVAEPEDDALLIAYDEEDEIVGYFGILPIMLRDHDNIDKVHWFTTWNVSSKVRGRGVGTQLMEYALTLKKDYLIVGSIYARRICRQFGFFERVFRYYWLDMTGKERLNPIVWLRRGVRKVRHTLGIGNSAFSINSRSSLVLDRFFSPHSKRWYYTRLIQSLEGTLDNFIIDKVDHVTDVDSKVHHSSVELHRDVDIVNWMLEYPWVLPPGESRTEDLDYYFSDVRPLFEFRAFQIYDQNKNPLGYVVYQISGKSTHKMIKVLDWKIDHADRNKIVLALAARLGDEFQADNIELPYQVGLAIPSPTHKIVLLHEKERVYQCHPKDAKSPLAKAWPQIDFKLADGDMPFS